MEYANAPAMQRHFLLLDTVPVTGWWWKHILHSQQILASYPYSLIFARSLAINQLSILHYRIKDRCGQVLLMVPKQRVLLLPNLDRTSTILEHKTTINIISSEILEYPGHQIPTCGINTLSPGATLGVTLLPSLSRPPGPTASTLASLSSLTLLSGRKIPPAVLASALTLWTSMRSRRGERDLMDLSAVDWIGRQLLLLRRRR